MSAITLNILTQNETAIITLVFKTIHEKELYIIAEKRFCKKFQAAYASGEDGNTEYNRKKRNLARAEFAKKAGFVPTQSDKLRWVRVPVKQTPKGLA